VPPPGELDEKYASSLILAHSLHYVKNTKRRQNKTSGEQFWWKAASQERFFYVMRHQPIGSIADLQSAAAVALSCRYWGMNDPLSCIYRNKKRLPMMLFSGPDTPPKLPLTMGGSRPHVIHGSLGPLELSLQSATRSVQPLLQGSRTWPTDRHTAHATPSVAKAASSYCCDSA